MHATVVTKHLANEQHAGFVHIMQFKKFSSSCSQSVLNNYSEWIFPDSNTHSFSITFMNLYRMFSACDTLIGLLDIIAKYI